MRKRPTPIIFVAFADPKDKPGHELPSLVQEEANVHDALKNGVKAEDWQYEHGLNCTRSDLVDRFKTNRVAVFHFGGHSNPQSLWLPAEQDVNQNVDGMLLEEFLATQRSLQLAFFNACSNREWAAKLAEHIPYVIATVAPLDDDIALEFSSQFYGYLASDCTVEDAFKSARRAVRVKYQARLGCGPQDSSARSSTYRTMDEAQEIVSRKKKRFPWILRKNLKVRKQPPWRLSIGADNPLVGVPPLDRKYYADLPDKPHVTIKGHEEKDAALFFGRNAEIRELYDWVLNSPNAPPIRLFYGQSGVGKSSLLNAGLLPRLKAKREVVYLWRNRNLMEDLHSAIGGSSDEDAKSWLSSPKPKLIILDQVEEAITHNDGSTAEIRSFITRVKTIFALRQPGSQARLILSFRKEYLAEIRGAFAEGSAEDAPELVDHFWLDRLDADGIVQVVTGAAISPLTRDHYKIRFVETESVPTDIANDLQDRDSPISTILQIVLNQLWDAAKPVEGVRTYTHALYKSLSALDNPLRGFFDTQIEALEKMSGGIANDEGLELDLLFQHTTDLATSKRCTLAYLKKNYPQVPHIEQLITRNKELYLLAEPAKEPGGADGATIEEPATALAHDTLGPIIRREFELSVLRGSRARRLVVNLAREWANGKSGDTLDAADLRVVKRGRDQMRALDPDEERMLKESRKKVKRRRLVQSAIVAALLLVAIVLLVGQQSITIDSLVKQADLLRGTDPFSADVHYLDAAGRFERSWRMKASLHPGLHVQLQAGVLGMFQSPEIDRIRDTVPQKFTGACGYKLDAHGSFAYQTRGSLGSWTPLLGGVALPESLWQQNPVGDCDPVSQTIVILDPKEGATGLLLWNKGALGAVAAPQGMVTWASKAAVNCSSQTADEKSKADALVKSMGVKVDAAAEAELAAAAKEELAACQKENLAARVGVESIALAPGAGKIAVVLSSGAIQVLDRPSGKLSVIDGGDSGSPVTFSADGRYLAQGNSKTDAVTVWDLEEPGRARQAGVVEGATLAAFGGTAAMPVLATGGKQAVQVFSLSSFTGSGPTAKARPSTGYASGPITALAVSHDGTFVAYSDPKGQVNILLVPPDLDFSKKNGKDGPAGFDQRNFINRRFNDWQLSNFPAGDGTVRSMEFGGDSTLLVTVSEQDNTRFIKTWNLTNARPAALGPFSEVVQAGCNRMHSYIWRNAENTAQDLPDFDFGEMKKGCSAVLGGR